MAEGRKQVENRARSAFRDSHGSDQQGLIGSTKDFDLYSKSNGKYVCSLNRKLFAKKPKNKKTLKVET